MSPTLAIDIVHHFGARYFPKLVPTDGGGR